MQEYRGTTARERVATRRHARHPRRRGWGAGTSHSGSRVPTPLLVTLALLTATVLGTLAVDQYCRDRVLPNVSVQGLPLGGLSREIR